MRPAADASRRLRRVCPFIIVLCLAAACGDNKGDSGQPPSTTASGATAATTLAPVAGGSLTFGANAQMSGLDPTIASFGGTSGGIELAALYDTLLRWNVEARKYEPRLAESVTPNAEFTEWTVKIRSAIKFSDGTDYNADAVKFNIERHLAPASRSAAKGYLSAIKAITVVDPLTVRFTLADAWAGFAFVFTREPGMIASPSAIRTLGADFNLNPTGAGAGPFQIVSFRPNEAIVMKKNPTYWNGPVYLDELRFVFIAGFPPRYEALKANTLQAAFLRDPAVIATAKSEKFPGTEAVVQASGWNINVGVKIACTGGKPDPACTGRPDGTLVDDNPPGKILKVRQAIVAALDPTVINERVRNGRGLAGNALFQSSFPWDPGVAGPRVDLNEAKRLVQEAKAQGWDGKLQLKCHNGLPDLALATQALLQGAGIDVSIKNDYDSQAFIADAITNKTFQLACAGLTVSADEGAFVALDSNLRSDSATNRVGYANPRMDAALKVLKVASTDDAKRAAFKEIATIFNADLPVAVFEATPEYVATSPNVHGIVTNSNSVVFFDKAWMQR